MNGQETTRTRVVVEALCVAHEEVDEQEEEEEGRQGRVEERSAA